MGGSRRIRARRQRRARARRRWQYALSVFVEKIIIAPLQTRRRYPLGVTPIVVVTLPGKSPPLDVGDPLPADVAAAITEALGPDPLDASVRDLSHLIDPRGY